MVGKSKDACYRRWNTYIVPALKSGALGVAQTVEWRKDALRYIIREKFASIKEVQYSRVVRDSCPGQTNSSVRSYLNNLSRYAKDMKFHEICKKHLTNPPPSSLLGNDEMAQEYLQHSSEILKLKQTLISNKLK